MTLYQVLDKYGPFICVMSALVAVVNLAARVLLLKLKSDQKQRDEELRVYGQQTLFQLIADGTLTIERVQTDEPEKAKTDFILDDDGELLEVIDDKPKRGLYDGND